MRIGGVDIAEGRIGGSVVFSSGPLYKQDGLMALFAGDTNSNASPDKALWKNLGSGGNAVLTGFGYAEGSGWTGQSLQFDGVNDGSAILTLPEDILTIECVMRKFDNGAACRPVTSWTFGGTQTGFGFGDVSDRNQNRFSLSQGNSYYGVVGSGGNYKIGVTYSVSVTYNAADNKFYFYANGALLGAITANAAFAPSKQIRFGQWSLNNAANGWFKGEIFSVRVYNRYLPETEILHNYDIDKGAYGV
jgi:hypothetical protein